MPWVSDDQRFWIGILGPAGNPAVFGGVGHNYRLQWTLAAAQQAVTELAVHYGLEPVPIRWRRVDETLYIGRVHKVIGYRKAQEWAAVVVATGLPTGEPPGERLVS